MNNVDFKAENLHDHAGFLTEGPRRFRKFFSGISQ